MCKDNMTYILHIILLFVTGTVVVVCIQAVCHNWHISWLGNKQTNSSIPCETLLRLKLWNFAWWWPQLYFTISYQFLLPWPKVAMESFLNVWINWMFSFLVRLNFILWYLNALIKTSQRKKRKASLKSPKIYFQNQFNNNNLRLI